MVEKYKKTNDEFLKELTISKPNIKPLEKYHGVDGRIKCRCKICNYTFISTTYVLLQNKGASGCRNCNGTRKRTHEEYCSSLIENNIAVIPLEHYNNSYTKILHKCKKCNYSWEAKPSNILSGCLCPVCANKVVVKGINDLWTTHPHIAEILDDLKEGYSITYGSGKKLLFRCPNCGETKLCVVNSVVKNGFSCKKCSDGISFPMKFTMEVLNQLSINYNTEVRFDWCTFYNPYKKINTFGIYDIVFEFNSQKYIIEVDGYFHHKDNSMNGQSKSEAFFIDAITDTSLIWVDDNVTCERVQRIYYDSANPRIELEIYPCDYIGVFDNTSQLEMFESNCSGCSRYKRNCSILQKAKEGRIQKELEGLKCTKYKGIS